MISPSQQNLIIDIVSKFNPTMLGVFGSFARGENNSASDLDILVDFDGEINLLDIISLEQDLTEVLGLKVDLITLKSLNAKLKKYIEVDLILLTLPFSILKQ